MGLPEHIQPLKEELPKTLKEIISTEQQHFLIGSYERSYPDAIQRTTSGEILVKIEENRRLSINPQVILIAEERGRELDRRTVVEGENYSDLFKKAEEIDREQLEKEIKQLYSGFISPDREQKPTIQRMREEIRNGYQKPNCPECGLEIKAEPDATSAYCDNCEESVTVPPTL